MRKLAILPLLALLAAPPPAAAEPSGQLFCFANDAGVLFRVKLRHTPRGGSETNPDWDTVTAGTRHCKRFRNPRSVRFQVQHNDINWVNSPACSRAFTDPGDGLIFRATGTVFSYSCSVQ